MIPRSWLTFAMTIAVTGAASLAQTITSVTKPEPNLEGSMERPLRYRPDGADFVIVNGGEFFNRPLYGGNTAFRVDAGDQPEFLLYLPGRGGNVRLGLRAPDGAAKWLFGAEHIESRYRPGVMLYRIRDPMLGVGGELTVTAVALHEVEGLAVRVEASAVSAGLELVWAYGGVNGQRGVRDGDIGTERVPISEYFQLRPEICAGNDLQIDGQSFLLRSSVATLGGHGPSGTNWAVAAAENWNDCQALLDGRGGETDTPVLAGVVPLGNHRPADLLVQRIDPAVTEEELAVYRAVSRPAVSTASATAPRPPLVSTEQVAATFDDAVKHFERLRNRVAVVTPDPFINAAVGALNVAADAVWDEPQGVVMHGAIAWRSRLLGWRGAYSTDALGWHERARRHLRYWAGRQNLDPIPAELPPPEEETNLARRRRALHSQGNLSNSHYDMNLVYIDALFRHLRWTGDLAFAREVWPMIERHLAWERRMFRREFTTATGEKLPLYEAYAAIWASDELQYHGGGVAYTSAYNAFHLREAARLATLLGHDPRPYTEEAALIERALREFLWQDKLGTFAEFKDLLGRQLIHPHPGLWTIYHVIDSEVATPWEARRLTRYVEEHLPKLPVVGPGVPDDQPFGVFASTEWMPYAWSVNNVVMGENVHTALAFWQAGRADEAFRLTKSALLAAMFMGICPGNSGSMSYLDVYRREAQRDFADGTGVLSRAVVEGLFGIRPALLENRLVVAPGLPSDWESAQLHHPDVDLVYQRDGDSERYRIVPRWPGQPRLSFQLRAAAAQADVRVNGQVLQPRWVEAEGVPAVIEVELPSEDSYEIVVLWRGEEMTVPEVPRSVRPAAPEVEPVDWPTRLGAGVARFALLDLTPVLNDSVDQIFRREYRAPRSPHVSLAQPKQGLGGWAGHVNAAADIDDRGLRARARESGGLVYLPNGVPLATPVEENAPNVAFTSMWENDPAEVTVPLEGRARQIYLLMAGSTNWMQSRIDNGEVIATYADGSVARLALHNPTTWWPIEQDYFVDDYQFRRAGAVPLRLDLQTGVMRWYAPGEYKGRGGKVPGGAATVLTLTLDAEKELQSLTVRALANEVVIGLMAATLVR